MRKFRARGYLITSLVGPRANRHGDSEPGKVDKDKSSGPAKGFVGAGSDSEFTFVLTSAFCDSPKCHGLPPL